LEVKTELHPRNRNRERYDLKALQLVEPELKKLVFINKFGNESIDFSSQKAVKILNRAILFHNYGLTFWDFPEENLCPPIPGRADYLHFLADLLAENNFGKIPTGKTITVLDIGTGASAIYPIIGVMEYNWNFIASDISQKSLLSAENIIQKNTQLQGKVDLRLQKNGKNIFSGILRPDEKIDLTMCNPPFHQSIKEAQAGSRRKSNNLTKQNVAKVELNFSGSSNELIFEGGELGFIKNMISESRELELL